MEYAKSISSLYLSMFWAMFTQTPFRKCFENTLLVFLILYCLDGSLSIGMRYAYKSYALKFDTCVLSEDMEDDDEEQSSMQVSDCSDYAYKAIWWIETYTRYKDAIHFRHHDNLLDIIKSEERKQSI